MLLSAAVARLLHRRQFLASAAAALVATRLPAQAPAETAITAHTPVAAMDHDLILAQAGRALAAQPGTLLAVSANVAALTAAFILDPKEHYAFAARDMLNNWLPTPISKNPQPPTVVELIPVAELARSVPFLADAVHLDQIDAWLLDLLRWITTARDPVIARDTHDHRASAWLFITAAVARSQRNNDPLGQTQVDRCRALFRKPTLRNQVDETGRFPQEMATANPFRNTLLNFDLLSGACQVLDDPLDPLWSYELIDGVGMHTVAAYLYPFLQDRNKWPGVADAQDFRELPGRRAGLLFCGRAFNRPEYVRLWHQTAPAVPPAVATSFPVRQPLLWTTRAPHGL